MDLLDSMMISYAVFSLFLFYQQLHLKKFNGSSEVFGFALTACVFGGMIYGIGFLLYLGFKVSWVQAGLLFVIAFAIKIVWFPIEAALGLGKYYWIVSLFGFAALPISGYFMWSSLP